MTESVRPAGEHGVLAGESADLTSGPLSIETQVREPGYQPPDFLRARVVAREYAILLARIGVVLCVGAAAIATIYLLNVVYRNSGGEGQRLIVTLPIVVVPLMLAVRYWQGWSRPERPRGRPGPHE